MSNFAIGDRVQLRVGTKPRGTVKDIVFPVMYYVEFDRKDTLGRKRWLCDPVELEPAMVCRRDGAGFVVVPE